MSLHQSIAALFVADGVNAKSLRAARALYRSVHGKGRLAANMDATPQKDGSVADEPEYLAGKLLSAATTNAKLAASDAATERYLTYGLSFAPARMNGLKTAHGRDITFCPSSGLCETVCLFGTGHARVGRGVRRARIGKSRLFVRANDAFLALLFVEIAAAQLKAEKMDKQLLVRLNVFSDLAWERVHPVIFSTFTSVQFYDYTKLPRRVGRTPGNYHLTFSRDESNEALALDYLAQGYGVAVVFEDGTFEPTWHGFPVIDGTLSDLRVLDAPGVVVALKEKNTELRGPKWVGKANIGAPAPGFILPTRTSNVHGQELSPL